MGGADTEIADATTDVLLEMAWFRPMAIARTSRRLACAPRRRPGSRRAPTPRSSTGPHAPLRRAAGALGRPARGGHGRRPGRPARPAARSGCAPAGSTRCSAPHLTADEVAELLEPIGFAATAVGGDGDARRRRSRRGGPTRHRDRRGRGGRPPLRLQPHRPAAAAVGPRGPADAEPSASAAAWSRRCWSASGCPRPCRCRSWRPATWPGPGCPTTASTITNPLVAEESVLRTSLLPGLLKALAYNARPPQRRRRPVRDRPRVPARRGRRRRAARRARVPGRGARRAGTRPTPVAGGGRWPRRSASHGVPRRATAASPGLHPTRVGPAGRRRRRAGRASVGEVDPERARRPRHRRAGRLARGRPRRRLAGAARRRRAVPPGQPLSRRATSTSPSRCRRRCPPATSRRPCAAAAATCSAGCALFDVYRGAGSPRAAAAWPTGCGSEARPHPHRRRGGRGPRDALHRRRSSASPPARTLRGLTHDSGPVA